MKLNHISAKILIFLIPLFCTFPVYPAKRTVPFSGRSYKINDKFSDGNMLALANKLYPQYVVQMGGDSNDAEATAIVNEVSLRLVNAAVSYMKEHGYSNELPFYEWEVHLVPAKGQGPNATCMPGGKILVFETLLPFVGSEDGLAAIIGHEIGHAIGHHIAEQYTKQAKKQAWQILGALGVGIAGIATKGDTESVTQVIELGVGLSNSIMEFVEMKFSREQENEADYIGLMLMSLAGYDPNEAPKIWETFLAYGGEMGGGLLDDHPANSTRIKNMRNKWMNEAMAYYRGNSRQSSPEYINVPSSNTQYYADKSSGESEIDSRSLPPALGLASTSSVSTPGNMGSNKIAKASSTSPSTNHTTSSVKQMSPKGQLYIVNNAKADIHSLPSKGSSVIGSLLQGNTVDVKNVVNGWASVYFNNKICYIEASSLSQQ